jgi:MFS family permease
MNQSRKNFILGVCHESAWGLSFGLTNAFTILPLALVDLGGSATVAGLLGALLFTGMNAPQFFSAMKLGPRFSDPKTCALMHAPAIALLGIAALTFLFLPSSLSAWKLPIFLTCFFGHYLMLGILMPHWTTCVSRNIPYDLRGRYFGMCFFFSGLAAAASGWLAGRWAAQGGLAWGYGRAFALAIPCQILSAWILSRTKSLAPAPEAPRAFRQYVSRQLDFIRKAGPFRSAALVAIFMQVAFASSLLYTYFLRNHVGISAEWFAYFTAAGSLGSTAGALLLGFLTDLKGSRVSLQLGFAVMLASLAAILAFHHELPLGLGYFLSGFFTAASSVVTTVVVLDMAGHQHSVAHVGLFNSLLAPFTAFTPILLGQLSESVGYAPAFSISGLACLVGLIVLWRNKKFGKELPPPPAVEGAA